jgi:hypothetical protein
VRAPRGLDGAQRLVLKFFTPEGHLYQELLVPVATEKDRTSPDDARRRRRYTVSGVLPLGGTAIVTSSLYGTWSVEAYIDDADTPCARPERFAIRP